MFDLRHCNATFGIPSRNFGACISVALYSRNKMWYACHGPYNNSLYSGGEYTEFDSPRLVKGEATPTNCGGRWLAQTNYDALMTHHTTENSISLIIH